jgi:hypothetical protein
MQKQQAQRDDKQQQPVGTRSKRPATATNKQQQKKGKGAKFCDTCDFNHTHWSNLCNRPKEDHDEDRMAP